jgi:hypothetical protein
MNQLEYREYTKDDFEDVLALDLRAIELREGWASTEQDPMERLALSISLSKYLWVITYRRKICGVFGLAISAEEGVTYGTPWMLSNDIPFATHSHRGLFLRTSKQVVMVMRSKVDLLMNIISLENKESVRWLRWLGFKIDDKPFTFDRDPDLHFVWFSMR